MPGLNPGSLFPGEQSLLNFLELLEAGSEAQDKSVNLNIIELINLLRKDLPLFRVVKWCHERLVQGLSLGRVDVSLPRVLPPHGRSQCSQENYGRG